MSFPRTSVGTGALLAALLLTGWDLVRICASAPTFDLGLSGGLAFLSVGASTTAWCLAVPLWARQLLDAGLGRLGARGAAMLGAIDAAALVYVALLIQDPRSISSDARVLIAIGAVVSLAALRCAWHSHRDQLHPSAARALGALLVAGSLAALITLRWNGSHPFRFALQVVFASGLVSLFSLPRPRSTALRMLPLATTAVIVCCASALLHSGGARFALHHRGGQVRPAIGIVEWLTDGDGDDATASFGGRDCDDRRAGVFPGAAEIGGDGVDHNCSGADGVLAPRRDRPPRVGEARGRDVLLLSIDSLRWDALNELASLRAALGEHVVFERAVSAAPATREGLSSAIRGRPLRRLSFEATPNARGAVLWRDPSPTLGHVLAQAGYRVVTVPTSHVNDPRNGLQSGFDSVWAANYDARDHPARRSPYARDYLSADEALAVVGATARATPGPLCAWVHLMESHAPYPVRDPKSCDRRDARSCYRAALRDTSDRLSAFVREFTRIRGKAPVIAVFGDHGEEFGEHGGDLHGSSVHAEQVRVSYLLSAAEVLPSLRVRAPVSVASMPATVLDLLGIEVPPSMLEPSLLPAIRGERPFPKLAVSELPVGRGRMAGYTGSRYRYLYDPVHEIELLFDMDMDPYERRDVSQSDRTGLLTMRMLARAWDESERPRDVPEEALSAETVVRGERGLSASPRSLWERAAD